MKIYEIHDEENNRFIGTLIYYGNSRTFIIELDEDLDEWSAPLLLASFVKKGIFTIPRQISFLWVKERIIPSGRQNIQSILRNHKMKEYDEIKFLELSHGRCSQDSLYIKKTDCLPEYAVKRMEKNLSECFVCDDAALLCFFHDGTIRKIDLHDLLALEHVDKILRNRKLMDSAKVSAGGYSVTFNDSIDIPATELYRNGISIPLKQSDFIAFVKNNIPDTTESCQLLECSRQNLSYLIRQDLLKPIKEDVRGNLFLKGDVLRNSW